MPLSNFPQDVQEFAIQVYEKPKDEQHLRENHVAFTGTPQKHPFNRKKVILVSDPYSSQTSYFEFMTADISFVEELTNIVNMDGEVIPMVRIWVKKNSVGVRSTPFIVQSTVG